MLRPGPARGSADGMASLVHDHAPPRDGARALARATVLGAASGVRTFSAPAALAARGHLGGRRGRYAVLAVAAGEMAADKSPAIPDRTGPPALGGRVGAGALSGHRVGGGRGALAGAVGAGAATFLSHHARTVLTERLPVPGAVVGVAEDVTVLCAVALATREPRDADADAEADPAERAAERAGRVAAGLVAAAAGTAAMTTAQVITNTLSSARPSDVPEQVGRKVLRRVFGRRVPRGQRAPLNQAMHWLYGTAWGVPLGVVAAGGRGGPPHPARLGPAFGLVVWAASLAELPLLGVAPPIWRRPPREIATDVGFHLVYGIAGAAALRGLEGEAR
jgi:hypothetical protein